VNVQKRIVLEDRMNILDQLEALTENNPYTGSYNIEMGDLHLTGSPASARNHFELLQAYGIASFCFDQEVSDLYFWHIPLHIENIDIGALMQMQDHTKVQLIQLDPPYFNAAPALPLPTGESSTGRAHTLLKTNKKLIAIVVGCAGFLASLVIIWTFIQGRHW
jgi:hypothetical protein